MDPIPPSRILSRISYFPSRSVPGCTTVGSTLRCRRLYSAATVQAVPESRPMNRFEEMRRVHRRLDELLGRFLAAAEARALAPAREEEELLPRAAGRGLAPAEDETAAERLGRELRLEHVQIRELSGVLRRLA